MRSMRDLHARGIGIAITGDDLDAEALQLDDHFLAEFTGAKKEDFRGGR